MTERVDITLDRSDPTRVRLVVADDGSGWNRSSSIDGGTDTSGSGSSPSGSTGSAVRCA